MAGSSVQRSGAIAAMPELARRPTFMLHRLNAELARICNPLFRHMQVDLITSRILVVLLERPRTYIGDIVELMALPQSTVSHQLKRLEQAGLVRREADRADQRAVLVRLTRKGRSVAQRCDQISAAIHAYLFEDFGAAQIEDLVARLGELDARLRTLDASELDV